MNLTANALGRLLLNSCFAVIAFAVLPAAALAQPAALQWELVNPFRFIQNQDLIDELKDVASKNTSASDLERALQDKSAEEVRRVRAATNCNSPSAEEKRRCFAPYSGWFAKVAEHNYESTCWDASKKVYRTDGRCVDYIDPRFHWVRVWVTNPEGLGDADPQWVVNPVPEQPQRACAAKYQHRFCIEFQVKHEETPIEVSVSAQFPSITLALTPNIKVRDLLIVGLGDSYASGEGNPDIPATFVDSDLADGRHADKVAAYLGGDIGAQYPRKERAAVWLDERCHRSMYSYNFKTALELALKYPQQAVTFLSFSCSGAETTQIFKDDQTPKEGEGKLKPQLAALADALKSSQRQIDYLLLSTGGNDIKFAFYVGYMLAPSTRFGPALDAIGKEIKRNSEKHKFEKKLLGEAGTIGNYVKLQNKLLRTDELNNPNSSMIRECRANNCTHVLLTAYPDVLTDEQGGDCKADRGEFDEFFGADQRVPRIQVLKQSVIEQLRRVQSQVPARLHWTLIDRTIDSYRGHGFCSQKNPSLSTGEIFQVPTWDEAKNNWRQFSPRDYQAYESRSRWFRLPVDSVLTTDQEHPHKSLAFLTSLANILEFARSNIMHPTAEGLAHTADLNVERIRVMEGLP